MIWCRFYKLWWRIKWWQISQLATVCLEARGVVSSNVGVQNLVHTSNMPFRSQFVLGSHITSYSISPKCQKSQEISYLDNLTLLAHQIHLPNIVIIKCLVHIIHASSCSAGPFSIYQWM